MKQVQALLALNLQVQAERPLWLKDGSGVIYASAATGRPEFWVAAADGSVQRQLTHDLGGLPFLATREGRCSPDGQWLAFLSNRADRSGEGRETELWLQPLQSAGPAQRLTRLASTINSFQWAPDSRSLVLSSTRHGRFDIFTALVPSGEARRLTAHENYEVYPTFTPDGKRILFVRLNSAWTDHEIWAIDVDGENPTLIAQDSDFFDYHYGRTFGYPIPSPDGGPALFRSQRSGWINYWSVPLNGDGELQPVCAACADQSEAAWSPDGKHLAFIENHDGNLQLRVLDVATGKVSILAGEGQGVCAHPSWSPDGRSIAYLFGTTTTPLALWVVDLKRSGEGHLMSTAHRRLTASDDENTLSSLVEPEKLVYPTFDGREISAYLYRPISSPTASSCPGLMWIHGGPTSQFMDTYQPQVQYFVQRGYVVLLPNIRGSSGYGREFEDLNNADWGGDDLKDVLAGAEFLKTLSEVNAHRLGIHGTSYGGCMSMSAVAFAPTAFQASIPHGGYGDWIHMYHEQELRHVQLLRFELGSLEENRDIYYKCSPQFHLSALQTPTLILHGAGKLPESASSRLFFEEARRLYKPVRYKVYPNECYYVHSSAGVSQMLADMLDFFDEHLKDA